MAKALRLKLLEQGFRGRGAVDAGVPALLGTREAMAEAPEVPGVEVAGLEARNGGEPGDDTRAVAEPEDESPAAEVTEVPWLDARDGGEPGDGAAAVAEPEDETIPVAEVPRLDVPRLAREEAAVMDLGAVVRPMQFRAHLR